ncbi:type I secretion system permease/ATPase [Terrarubrum flagellatum]|uniref:type I secretion system permease/ATPase n=1 Tax=Terrirubrum flagellatum TaxID=2895980 RepID=UPI003144D819
MILKNDSILWQEVRRFSPAIGSLALFSFILALMYLVPSIYMHQLFERVFQSRSQETLFFLAGIVLFLCAIWTALEIIRIRTLQRMSFALDERISKRVFEALNRQTDSLPAASRNAVMQDLQTIREFFSGTMLTQGLDFIWVPVILAATYLYHPLLGLTLTVLTMIVVVLALTDQMLVRDDTKRALLSGARAAEFGRAVISSAEPARVMGMLPALAEVWRSGQRNSLGWQAQAVRRGGLVTDLIKFSRHVYSPIMLTVGTLLYLNEAVGAGVIFAASILTSRAIYPVDNMASNWRQFWNFRMAASRVEVLLQESEKRISKVNLPTPDGPLVVSRMFAAPRNRDQPVLNDISFSLSPGEALGVVGASGAGKSSLARVLVGAWPVQKGSVGIDGNDLAHWDQDQLGRHIGYVPQDVELLPGTVADNIARFDAASEERDAALLEATRAAGVQDIIQRLPDGLNTKLGPDGHTLSGGQRQRIALARAVYGNPKLLVLDEPNSNLDAIGEESLGRTISALRERGTMIVIVTHRTNILACCDRVLVMNAGTVHAFGRREQILERLSSLTPQKQLPAGSAASLAA